MGITVPLQMVEFYFILSAVNDKIGSGMFFRLFCGTVMMLAFGYAGESHFLMAWPATVFFLMESTAVGTEWKTSLNVGALVTLVAAVHYFYMREFWIIIGTSPILYRYIDWSITVPLQMVEFYFILS